MEGVMEGVVVVTDVSPPAPPCGLCLQTLAEFSKPDLPVLLVNPAGERRQLSLQTLLPIPCVLPRPAS